ncbi:MAG: sensor histidine kinase, partial [Alphaproteobacteria bacterium]
ILATGVLGNLVSNALKFSHPGSLIRVAAARHGDEVRLSVCDRGMGIPAPLLDDLFRWDRPTAREGTAGEFGTGFGLPLVRRYVEMFGGRITVESRDAADFPDDHGTCVHIALPAAPVAEPRRA